MSFNFFEFEDEYIFLNLTTFIQECVRNVLIKDIDESVGGAKEMTLGSFSKSLSWPE